MRSLVFIALGFGFILMGAGLIALTLGKRKELPPQPTKTQLREQAARAAEDKKMRLGGGIIAAVGLIIALIFLF